MIDGGGPDSLFFSVGVAQSTPKGLASLQIATVVTL
jgi:hypothetical protein